VLLLADIRAVFAGAKSERLRSADIAAALAGTEGRPWAEYRDGRPLTKHALSRLLTPFGIGPQTIRIPRAGCSRIGQFDAFQSGQGRPAL
jgi:hypothetical protein